MNYYMLSEITYKEYRHIENALSFSIQDIWLFGAYDNLYSAIFYTKKGNMLLVPPTPGCFPAKRSRRERRRSYGNFWRRSKRLFSGNDNKTQGGLAEKIQ